MHPCPEKPTESDCNMSSRASEFKRRKNIQRQMVNFEYN